MSDGVKILVVDTETTGLPLYKSSVLDSKQPWPVQVGAVLMELGEGTFQRTLNKLVLPPEGTYFHPRAVETHGITEEMVMANGSKAKEVFEELLDMSNEADIVAAYNLQFDEFVIRSASQRTSKKFIKYPVLGNADKSRHMCIMKLTAANLNLSRWIKLEKAYEIYTGRTLTEAHDALADTVAAAEVYREILVRELK